VNGHEFATSADADLAGDICSRKSTIGFVVVLAESLVSWMSKLQSTVALSTAEAETNVSVEAVKQIMHFRLFMRELGMGQDGPSVVFEDNQAAIAIAQKEEQSKRSKHYLIKAAFLTDSYKRGIFRYAKVGTKEQLADAFTKPVDGIHTVELKEFPRFLHLDAISVERDNLKLIGGQYRLGSLKRIE
jgi:hypothetical protein